MLSVHLIKQNCSWRVKLLHYEYWSIKWMPQIMQLSLFLPTIICTLSCGLFLRWALVRSCSLLWKYWNRIFLMPSLYLADTGWWYDNFFSTFREVHDFYKFAQFILVDVLVAVKFFISTFIENDFHLNHNAFPRK